METQTHRIVSLPLHPSRAVTASEAATAATITTTKQTSGQTAAKEASKAHLTPSVGAETHYK